MSWLQSAIGASVRDAMTPFIAATYGSRVPKSVIRATRRIGSLYFLRVCHRPTAQPAADGLRAAARARKSENAFGRIDRSGEGAGGVRGHAARRPAVDRRLDIGHCDRDRVGADRVRKRRRAFGDHLLAMQTGTNLGERLAMAFSERFFFHRAEKIIAIGVDDPTLTRETIDHAFGLLESCEWVIGPAHDGGYYLIGCRGASFKPAIFVDMPWGTDAVMRLTVQRIREWEQTLTILPAHYDIDVIDDLKRFASETRDSEAELPRLLRAWGIAA